MNSWIWIQEFLEFLISTKRNFEYTSDMLVIYLNEDNDKNWLYLKIELWTLQEILSICFIKDWKKEILTLSENESSYEFLIKYISLKTFNS